MMAMKTGKRYIVNYSNLNGLGISEAKLPKIDTRASQKF